MRVYKIQKIDYKGKRLLKRSFLTEKGAQHYKLFLERNSVNNAKYKIKKRRVNNGKQK